MVSLLTIISIEKTTKNVVDSLFFNNIYQRKRSTSEHYYLLNLTTYESSFIFSNTLYKQIDGVAKGFPLKPTLANAFLYHPKKLWLDNCPPEVKHFV